MKKLMLPLLIFFTLIDLQAQKQYVQERMKTTVRGTSSQNKWKLTSQEGESRAQVELNERFHPHTLTQVSFSVPVKSLKSNQLAINENVYYALNANKFDKIRFSASECHVEKKNFHCKGDLTVAGASQPTELVGKIRMLGPQIQLTGTHALKLSDFHIKIPSTIRGNIETGDVIDILFDIILQKEK